MQAILFFLQIKDIGHAKNLKWILTYFELMSGMMINYHKSELVPINYEVVEERQ
jgi:hypothetical protein